MEVTNVDPATEAYLSRLALFLSPLPYFSSLVSLDRSTLSTTRRSSLGGGGGDPSTSIQCRACKAELVGGVNSSVRVERRGRVWTACRACGWTTKVRSPDEDEDDRGKGDFGGKAKANPNGRGEGTNGRDALGSVKKRRRAQVKRERDLGVHPTQFNVVDHVGRSSRRLVDADADGEKATPRLDSSNASSKDKKNKRSKTSSVDDSRSNSTSLTAETRGSLRGFDDGDARPIRDERSSSGPLAPASDRPFPSRSPALSTSSSLLHHDHSVEPSTTHLTRSTTDGVTPRTAPRTTLSSSSNPSSSSTTTRAGTPSTSTSSRKDDDDLGKKKRSKRAKQPSGLAELLAAKKKKEQDDEAVRGGRGLGGLQGFLQGL
ncbi:hypothetical protein JCM10212_000326 [Sporobolomyces blumeae]